jgi:hypothetical protein
MKWEKLAEESSHIMDKKNARLLEWGNTCKAWFLLENNEMGIIFEEMPFFYVIKGVLGVAKKATNEADLAT